MDKYALLQPLAFLAFWEGFRTICLLCGIGIKSVISFTAMNNEQRLLMLRLARPTIYSQLLRLWVARRRQRRWWVRRWSSLRPEQEAYGNLMMLFRNEDVVAFRNFTRLSPQMFKDLVKLLTPRLRKEDTGYRDSLEVALKMAITLWHSPRGTTTGLWCI